MTRIDVLADALRGSYWITTASQGDAYWTWDELDGSPAGESVKERWRDIARRFEQRIERQGYYISKMISAEDC